MKNKKVSKEEKGKNKNNLRFDYKIIKYKYNTKVRINNKIKKENIASFPFLSCF